ncbi:alpha-amylase family protein [Actinophytocola sp.]|uniref:alpha-amylase family protein n=1 Tax=Actinophytocola sp. TaxID=1872138 RepID=UPI002D62CF78|nr:alpha-amylase family protein [Actinophytocola sp.]HYQ69679.1 alpha-amylase family protein [Actinophytocola sp.]
MTEPDWVRHAIWWHVYPLGFTGAEPHARQDVVHRLTRLESWLDYAIRLGASGLALGPIFAAETHGYDTIDHYRVDPRLGDVADFGSLVDAAHAKGLKVLLDGVFNHAGRSFARPGLLAGGTFEGHDNLATLDHDSPAVRDYVTDVMCHWLAAGADGWRLDAAYATPRPFWTDVLARVSARHPHAYLLGEVIHGDYPAIVAETGMHAVTQYELWKAIWSSLNDRNLFELAWALKRHAGYLDSFVPLTFVGNHDVTRIATRLTDERLLPHALAILFTTGGTPAVYYGDEQAFQGHKEEREGGDDAVRPQFPADPAGLAPWGAATFRLHQDLIGLRRRNPWLHNARTTAEQLTNTTAVLETTDGTHRLTTVLNLAEEPIPLPQGTVLLGQADPGSLPALGWAVLG